MQGDDIALFKKLLEWRVQAALFLPPFASGEQYTHAQGPPYGGNRLPERALTYYAQGRAGQVFDGIVKIAELLGVMPAPGLDRLAIGHDVAPQGEYQGKSVFRHG